jgi:hypothetical protein
MARDPSRWATAVHEAGHAVAAAMSSTNVCGGMELHADGSGGVCWIFGGIGATVAMAGAAAEMECLGRGDLSGGDVADLEAALEVAPHRLGFHAREAARLVRRHRAAVLALAAILYDTGRVDGWQVGHVLRRHGATMPRIAAPSSGDPILAAAGR